MEESDSDSEELDSDLNKLASSEEVYGEHVHYDNIGNGADVKNY